MTPRSFPLRAAALLVALALAAPGVRAEKPPAADDVLRPLEAVLLAGLVLLPLALLLLSLRWAWRRRS
jgi:hypothetical protein